ncbi:Ig-like domain-containing protein [Hymenobacter daecheongensis]|nr:Ig-like domain-containing protein [Hymenobacter daecheongensis]
MMFILLLLFPGLSRAQGQAPNVTYQGPITITKGGTYSGNYRSTNSDVPVIKLETTEPVIIENCILAGAGDLIDAKNGGSNLIIRNNRGYGLTQSKDNTRHGVFVEVNSGKSVVIEHNYFEHTIGILIYLWGGNGTAQQTLTIRYNQAKNIDGRYRNGGGTFANFLGMNGVLGLVGSEIAWNQVINDPDNSLVEDNINLYNSSGVAGSPIRMHDNYIQGAYPFPATSPNYTGSGITLDGDNAGPGGVTAHVDGYNNQLVSTCAAMNIAGGHDNIFHDNRFVTSGYLPDGRKLQANYAGAGLWNAYGQPSNVFYNNKFDNNTIGFVAWGGNEPFKDRRDLSPGACGPCYNTNHMPNPVTLQQEQSEWTSWQQKVQQNGLTIGVGGGTTPPPTPTNTPPTVSLSVPSTGTVGTALTLSATAADANGTVTKVEFFNGATKLGEDTSAPYSLSYTPTAASTLSLTARATDNAGAATSTAATSVTISAPTTGGGTGGTGTPTNATFVRALNLNGPAATIDGLSWEAGNGAANFQVNGMSFENQGIALNPATDAARAHMIRSSVFNGNITATVGGVANATYQVYLYVWEDNNPVTFNISVEGQTVQSNYSSGNGGRWDRLGPFTANVTDGNISINLAAANGGNANLSGIEIWKAGTSTTPTNAAPTVTLTAPATGTVGQALSLTATAADADGTVSKVEFFNGTTKLGEDLTSPYALSFTPTAAGTLSLTARATDNAGAATTSAAKSVTVAGVATPPPAGAGTFYRAININGSAMTLDGNAWQGSTAANYTVNGGAFANQNVALTPATDASRASMIRSSVFGPALNFKMTAVPNGSYDVYMYVWEDNNAETYSLSVNGQPAVSNFNSGSAGSWKKMGPYAANVTAGTITITSSGGYANLSGVEVWKK